MKTNIFPIAALFTLIIGLGACSKKETTTPPTAEETPVNVISRELLTTEISNNITFSGRIEAAEKVELGTRLMGTIEKINVKVGDKVHAGQVLFTISTNDLSAKKAQLLSQKEQASVIVQNLEKDRIRTENLFKKESATQKQLDDITTAVKTAQSNLVSIEAGITEINANMDYATVKAPFNGFVSAKMTDEGNISSPGMPVVSLVSEHYKAVVMVSENQINGIKQGETVNLSIPSIQKTIEAKVTQVAPSGAYNAGQFTITVEPTKKSGDLKDGLYAQVELNNSTEKVLLLHPEEIVTRGQLQGVFVLGKDNEAVLNWIRLGEKVGDNFLVIAGLSAGEKVIHSTEVQLRDGQKVTIK